MSVGFFFWFGCGGNVIHGWGARATPTCLAGIIAAFLGVSDSSTRDPTVPGFWELPKSNDRVAECLSV